MALSGWTYSQSVTVAHSNISSTLSNFPVFVNLANMSTGFWTHVLSTGADVRVTLSDGTTETPFQLVNFNSSAQTGSLFFKASSLSTSTDTVFYIYYGNSSASAYSASATYGSQNVWDSYSTAVYHLDDTSGGAADSTANGYNLTTVTGTPTYNAGGLVGGGLQLGGSAYISGSGIPGTAYGGNWSSSIWYKGTQASGDIGLFSHIGSGYTGWFLENDSGTGAIFFNGGRGFGTSINDGNWHKLESTYNSTSGVLNMYTDGGLSNSYPYSQNANQTATTFIGTWDTGSTGGGGNVVGILDEARTSTLDRSAAWVSASYTNEKTPTSFYSIGSEQSSGTVVTKTQTAVARIAQNLTKTQAAIARIAKNFTKTQSSVANIVQQLGTDQYTFGIVFSKTQSAIARIANTLTKTQASVSRIANNIVKTQPAIARISLGPTVAAYGLHTPRPAEAEDSAELGAEGMAEVGEPINTEARLEWRCLDDSLLA